jgi:hypothetical protein
VCELLLALPLCTRVLLLLPACLLAPLLLSSQVTPVSFTKAAATTCPYSTNH